MDKLRALVEERKALLARAKELADSMRTIPKTKRAQHEYRIVRIADLTPEEQSKVIKLGGSRS
jgi:hypothetical protein